MSGSLLHSMLWPAQQHRMRWNSSHSQYKCTGNQSHSCLHPSRVARQTRDAETRAVQLRRAGCSKERRPTERKMLQVSMGAASCRLCCSECRRATDASREVSSTRDIGCENPAQSGSRAPERRANGRIVVLAHSHNAMQIGQRQTVVRMFFGMFVRMCRGGRDWMGVGLKRGG